MNFIIRFIVLSLGVFAAGYFLGGVEVSGLVPALLGGLALLIIHFTIKPILKILTLPVNILTLGLFSLVLNGLFFLFVANVVNGLSVDGFSSAFLGALIISVINWIADALFD